jgi:hypothetical protein
MKPFVDRLVDHIGANKETTLTAAGICLRAIPNFEAKAREALINQKSLVANTLRLFPNYSKSKLVRRAAPLLC